MNFVNQPTYETIVSDLVQAIPEFEPTYRVHVEQYGEVLAHVLFAEFVRYTKRVCDAVDSPSPQFDQPVSILQKIYAFLETAASSNDEKVLELVQVSFMENLHQLGSQYARFSSQLGKKSRQLLERVESPES